MAKQRRPSKPAKAKPSASSLRRSHTAARHAPAPASRPAPAIRRSTYIEAVAIYERGLDALQRHNYRNAADLFESVLRQYPEEKELQERVRLYLSICQRQATRDEPEPQTVEERLFASTIAINGGKYDEAISHLRLVRDEDPDNDHALYMLAVAHAQRGEHAEAVAHIERAIAMNPENRGLARNDPDLDPLRGDDSFRTALEAPSVPRAERRRPLRTRPRR
jgi:outer membrane protein assembly factor BamD (BamD/ComL family)